MTPSNTSALPLGGAPRSAPRTGSRGDHAALVAERLAARRQRVRTIRNWVVAFAVTLFLAVAIVIVAQSHLVSSSPSSTSSGSTSSVSGTSSSSGSVSPVTSSQS